MTKKIKKGTEKVLVNGEAAMTVRYHNGQHRAVAAVNGQFRTVAAARFPINPSTEKGNGIRQD